MCIFSWHMYYYSSSSFGDSCTPCSSSPVGSFWGAVLGLRVLLATVFTRTSASLCFLLSVLKTPQILLPCLLIFGVNQFFLWVTVVCFAILNLHLCTPPIWSPSCLRFDSLRNFFLVKLVSSTHGFCSSRSK